jgi:parvulin-like peptidyl-prolyl isomerase
MEEIKLKIRNYLINLNPDILNSIKFGNMLPLLLKNFFVYEIVKDIKLENTYYENEIKNFYLDQKISNKEALLNYLRIKGLTIKELHNRILLNLKIYNFAKRNLGAQLKEHFLKRKELLDKYTFNILRVKDKDFAYELYFQIDNKESDFLKISENHSFYSDLYPKGIYGPKNLEGINPIIRNKLLNSDVGNLIEPFQVDEWWIIIKLLEKKDAKLDNQTSRIMFSELFENYIKELVKTFIEENSNLVDFGTQ